MAMWKRILIGSTGRLFWVFLFLLLLVFSPAGARSQTAVSSSNDMIAQARDAYNDRRFQDSATLYNNYLKEYPDGPDREEAGFFHGQSLFLLRDLAEADKALASEENRNKKYADQILFYRGEIAALGRDYNRALVFFDRLLGEYPDSIMAAKARERTAELHFRMGDQYFSQGAYSLALQQYKQTEGARQSLKPMIAYRLGTCHARLGDSANAVQTFGDLSVDDEGDSRDAALPARYRLARLLEDRGLYADAEVNYQAFLDAAPDHYLSPPARDGLARAWAKQGKKEEAIAYWKSSGGGSSLAGLSTQYEEAVEHYLHREYADAERMFSGLSSRSRDRELLWKAGLWLSRTYAEQGRADKALSAWQTVVADKERAGATILLECAFAVLKWDPETSRALASRVLENASAGQLEEALGIQALAMSAENNPRQKAAMDTYLGEYPKGKYAGELLPARASLLMVEGDLEGAKADLEAAASLHPDPEGRLAALRLLGGVYSSEGLYDSALKTIDRGEKAARLVKSAETGFRIDEALVHYARGEYSEGIAVFEELCGDTSGKSSCSDDDRFNLFWGCYRAGMSEEAYAVLDVLAAGGGEWAFRSGLWRGVMLMEAGSADEAFSVLSALHPETSLQAGFMLWEIARAQEAGGAFGEAAATLAMLDDKAPGSGFFTRGKVLSLALEDGDFDAYLAGLPDPAELDQDYLSEQALLQRIRDLAASDAKPSELEALNRVLQVEASTEEVAEEGMLWVAKSGLYGAGRPEAMTMLDRILALHPGTPFAGEIKLYKGEEAFFKKDYFSAVSWLGKIAPVDVPENLRFRLLYLQGQSNKMIRDLAAMRPYFLALVKDYKDRGGEAREWLDVGVGLTLAREFSAARIALDLAIGKSKDPNLLAEAHYWKGMVLAGSDEQDAALEAFMSVARDYPGQGMWVPTALYEAAEICVQKGDYDQALTLYQRVLDMSRGDKARTDKVKAKMAEAKKLKRLQNPIFGPR